MKKAIISIILIIALVLLMAIAAESPSHIDKTNENENQNESLNENIESNTKKEISVSGNLISIEEEKDLVCDKKFTEETEETEYLQNVLLRFGDDVTDFKFFEGEIQFLDDETMYFAPIKELYSVDSIKKDEHVLIKTIFFCTMPRRGFSFKDKSGSLKTYSISESGKDGSLIINLEDTINRCKNNN